MGEKTILRQFADMPEPQELIDERVAKDRCAAVMEGTVRAYCSGEITHAKALQIMCRAVSAPNMNRRSGEAMLGHAVLEMHAASPPRKGRTGPKGEPAWHREVALAGLPWAKAAGGVLSRAPAPGRASAYVLVAEYLTKLGLATTAAQVEEWQRKAAR